MLAIDIVAMPVAEKLKLMEAIWDSLSVGANERFQSPSWHGHALKHTEEQLAEGSTHFVDWADAKARLRKGGQV